MTDPAAPEDDVRAAVIERFGEPPVVRKVPVQPPAPGQALVRLLAAGLNPVDLAIGSGRFYGDLPEPPFVAGAEAVGEVVAAPTIPPGTRVWCLGRGTGCFAERFAVDEERLVPVQRGVPDALAAGIGVAGLAGWIPVRRRGGLRPGETVLCWAPAASSARSRSRRRCWAAAREGGGGGAQRGGAGAGEGARRAARPWTLGEGDPRPPSGRPARPARTWWSTPSGGDVGRRRSARCAPRARTCRRARRRRDGVPLPAGPCAAGGWTSAASRCSPRRRRSVAAAYARSAGRCPAGAVRVTVEGVPLAEWRRAWARQVAGAAASSSSWCRSSPDGSPGHPPARPSPARSPRTPSRRAARCACGSATPRWGARRSSPR